MTSPPSVAADADAAATTTVSESTSSSSSSSHSQIQGVWDALTRHASVEWATRPSLDTTRHRTDFDVLLHVGRGAFGVVTKVRHRLDGNVYAMKQVPILPKATRASLESTTLAVTSQSASTSRSVLLREVQILSRVQHENVVRYYGAWIEQGSLDEDFRSSEDDDAGDSTYTNGNSLTLISSAANGQQQNRHQYQDYTVLCHICQNYYTDWEVSFEQWGLIDAVLQPLNLCQVCYRQSLPVEYQTQESAGDTATSTGTTTTNGRTSTAIHIRHKVPPQHYLFILMEYCGDGTLADVMMRHESCDTDNDNLLWSYFMQCVQGVAACHAAGCIHRDIKPHNIFLSNQTVKIGDLGLATMRQNGATGSTTLNGTAGNTAAHSSASSHNRHVELAHEDNQTTDVGTYLYSAPEVATGMYSASCDVFSLGVVLVELFSRFGTSMERAIVLGRLRLPPKNDKRNSSSCQEVLPDELGTRHPMIASLARRMLQHDPDARPTCADVLHEFSSFVPSSCISAEAMPAKTHIPVPTVGLVDESDAPPVPVNTADPQRQQQEPCCLLEQRIAQLQEEATQKDATIQRLQALLALHGIEY